MIVRGQNIKCISNFQAPELVVGKVYVAGDTRMNYVGVWQVEVDGKWYTQHRFEIMKEKEMKKQFFVGDSVRICDTPQNDTHTPMRWDSGMNSHCGEVGVIDATTEYQKGIGHRVRFDSGVTWYFAPEWITIVERAWQKNTGEQPVEYHTPVFYKQRGLTYGTEFAGELIWGNTLNNPITEWRLADNSSSDEDQPEPVPPSHVALGDELVPTDVTTEQDKKHSHYFKKCGYDYVDVYRVLKMFDVTDPCISHAAKKLLVSGGRGFKDIEHDIQDVIDTLVRWQEMRKEDCGKS